MIDVRDREWSGTTRAAMRRAAVRWFDRHARDLPWRRTRDPYHVWLSEVMLQQTQVATVVDYFERFLAAFPGLRELAAAEEADVLRLWEGLGYYRRARQLHAAARRIVADHRAEFPHAADALRQLPGIGRYTAGAIASIAFDAREPILEANTLRLLARLLAERDEVTRGPTQARLWRAAAELLPMRQVGQFNQALMEIGALVCTPRTPRCDECPLARWCRARALGIQDQLPVTRAKMPVTEVTEAAVVVRHKGRVLVRQRAAHERWAGMWDFPRFPLDDPASDAVGDELRCKTVEQTGVWIQPGDLLGTLRHCVTRFRITLHCYEARRAPVRSQRSVPPTSALQWLRPLELERLPLSVTGRKICRWITGSIDRAS